MVTAIIITIILVCALAFYISRQPDSFSVTRSALIHATPDAVFAHVNDLHKWEHWSPWAKMDPNAKTSFDGPASGTGSSMSWRGKKTGKGSMHITQSQPHSMVQFRLEFIKPMKATNSAEFIFVPEGSLTKVTWSMWGTNNFIGKAMSLIFNCDKMVGTSFEEGLASLRSVVESKPLTN